MENEPGALDPIQNQGPSPHLGILGWAGQDPRCLLQEHSPLSELGDG